jgi:hypothetical protein
VIRLLDGHAGTTHAFGRDLRSWDRSYYRRIGVAFEAPNHLASHPCRSNRRSKSAAVAVIARTLITAPTTR